MSAVGYVPPVGESVRLGTIQDVDLSTPPTDGQVLAFNASQALWIPADGGGGGATLLNDLLDVNATLPGDGALIIYDQLTQTWRSFTVTGDGTLDDVGTLRVAQLSVGGLASVLATADGVDLRDLDGIVPQIRFLSSIGGILAQIRYNGDSAIEITPTIGGSSLVVEDNFSAAEARLTSTGSGTHGYRMQNSEGQARVVTDGDSIFLQVNTSPTSNGGWTTVLGRGPTAPVVTGSRGGNAALASLLTALDQIFLIDDQSTA